MPNKLGFWKAIEMGAFTGGVCAAVGAVVVGAIGAAIGGPAVGVTAAVWAASICGGLGTLLGGFACGMADDSNGGKVMLAGAAATALIAFGVSQFKPNEPPSKTSALDTHISAPFNASSKGLDTKTLTVFARKPAPAVYVAA